jgi:predicted O-methyltransferase YrrM
MIDPFQLETWKFLAVAAAGIFVAAWILHADFRRRRIRANAYLIAIIAGGTALAVAHFASRLGITWFGGLLGLLSALLLLGLLEKVPLLEFLDACSPAGAAGYGTGLLGVFFVTSAGSASTAGISLTPLYGFFIQAAIAAFLWRIGTRATLGPRPKGEIFACYFILFGAASMINLSLRGSIGPVFGPTINLITSAVFFLYGAFLLWGVLSGYHKISREHRILQHVAERGEIVQPEYSQPTPECPHPERWRMYDSMTAEFEVLDFLKTLVTTIKPELVVETGTFLGTSTLRIAEGLRENGFGRVITCENDPKVFEEARKRFQKSGLAEWIELRNESSLELKIEGRIDLLYCDSDLPLRETEVRWYLPQINSNGLILMHDASSSLKTVREGARNLEREGLISVVLLPTPRGLVIAQKREGRT